MIHSGPAPERRPRPDIYDFRRLCLVVWVATTAYLSVSITRAILEDW